jgi:hypothetical protein
MTVIHLASVPLSGFLASQLGGKGVTHITDAVGKQIHEEI